MIKWLVFDLNGVLFNHGTLAAREKYHKKYQLSDEAIKEHTTDSGGLGRHYRLGRISPETKWTETATIWQVKDSWHNLYKTWLNATQLDPKTYQLLKQIKASGRYHLAVMSNIDQGRFEKHNQKYHLKDLFEVTLLSFEDKVLKPDENAFDLLAERCQLGEDHRDQAVLIDDKKVNIEGANKYKFQGLLFQDIARLRRDLKKLKVEI